jgi:hypothetical protein
MPIKRTVGAHSPSYSDVEAKKDRMAKPRLHTLLSTWLPELINSYSSVRKGEAGSPIFAPSIAADVDRHRHAGVGDRLQGASKGVLLALSSIIRSSRSSASCLFLAANSARPRRAIAADAG